MSGVAYLHILCRPFAYHLSSIKYSFDSSQPARNEGQLNSTEDLKNLALSYYFPLPFTNINNRPASYDLYFSPTRVIKTLKTVFKAMPHITTSKLKT